MDWDALHQFIRTEDPAFFNALHGVPRDELRRIEELCEVRLPSSYRQFLLSMGLSSAGFYLFGRGYDHQFESLAADLPADSYPGTRYFKIAVPNDDAEISPPDYFLALDRSDDVDAPIVSFEDMGQFRPEYVREFGFTFGEWLNHALFLFLVVSHAAERSAVVVGSPSVEAANTLKAEAVELLERIGLRPALPPLNRVTCLRRGQLGAIVDVLADGLGVAVNLGADDRRALQIVIDQLLMRFPDAAVSGVGGPPGAGM